jgi:hypothetical protein
MQTNEELEIKKENEDLKTRKPRTMVLNLTDIQIMKLNNISNMEGLKPSEVLESFIGDLVDYHRNGSDEMILANDWLVRAIEEKRRY